MNKTFIPADILLPKTDITKWSVIACDQYTSDKAYWEKVADTAADAPSALNVVFPEVYLSDNKNERIKKINSTMLDYIENDVFTEYKNTFIYLERTLKNGAVRKGIIGCIDLEDYDYKKGANSLVRATEATVLDRIPPRVQIRKDAAIELPHVMLLIDDIDNTVIGPVSASAKTLEKVYDFELMLGAGSAKGYLVNSELANGISAALDNLAGNTDDALLFAVGDGNHSLATAKACYEMDKNPLNRYALVEVVNIHDESLNFEPIYRALFNVQPEQFIEKFVSDLGGEYNGADAQEFTCVWGNNRRTVRIRPTSKLAVGTLQQYLDERGDIEIDYIHDEDALVNLCKNDNTLGFLFDSMGKSDLFPAVKADGSLPRKTFSMGCADDKRFYIEARKIK